MACALLTVILDCSSELQAVPVTKEITAGGGNVEAIDNTLASRIRKYVMGVLTAAESAAYRSDFPTTPMFAERQIHASFSALPPQKRASKSCGVPSFSNILEFLHVG